VGLFTEPLPSNGSTRHHTFEAEHSRITATHVLKQRMSFRSVCLISFSLLVCCCSQRPKQYQLDKYHFSKLGHIYYNFVYVFRTRRYVQNPNFFNMSTSRRLGFCLQHKCYSLHCLILLFIPVSTDVNWPV
jgi:hypothetical protein